MPEPPPMNTCMWNGSVGFADKELVRRLHQNAGAVAGARIGADRTAMFEIAQDRERVLDDLVRLAALDVGDEADTAGILFVARIEQAVRGGHMRPQREFEGRIFNGPLRRRSAHSHFEPLCRHRRPHGLRRPSGAPSLFAARAAMQTHSLLVRGGFCRSPVPHGTARRFLNAAALGPHRNWDSNAVLICRNLAWSARVLAA